MHLAGAFIQDEFHPVPERPTNNVDVSRTMLYFWSFSSVQSGLECEDSTYFMNHDRNIEISRSE